MSMTNIPPHICTDINIDRKGLVDLLLISIALEELSLAHIINAEGELLQEFICEKRVTKENLIKVNRSVSEILRLVLEKENALIEKLRYIIQFNEDYCEK